MMTIHRSTCIPSLTFSPERESFSRDSDSTLEEPTGDANYQTLERVVHLNADDECFSGLRSLSLCNLSSDSSDASSTSSLAYDIDFEAVVDDLLANDVPHHVDAHELITVSHPSRPVMLKRFSRSSSELLIVLELSCAENRADPFNPAPHILSIVERDDEVFLFFEPLIEYNRPPFKTVADYLEFFRQCLEGLTFLHELGIAHLQYSIADAFMVDIGPWPPACFDRARYPVRYYNVNFSKAVRTGSKAQLRRDLSDGAVLIDHMLPNVPMVRQKIKMLVDFMKVDGHSAEDARNMLETLCASFEGSVFELSTL